MAHVVQYVESKKSRSSSNSAAVDIPQVTVKLINESPAFQGIMYMSSWKKSSNKVVGSQQTLTGAFTGKQIRLTFAARLGAYAASADTGYYVALAIKSPGVYEARIGGVGAQHVRVRSITKVDGVAAGAVDWHQFKKYEDLDSFMSDRNLTMCTYSVHVHE